VKQCRDDARRTSHDRKEKRVRCYVRRIPDLGFAGVPGQGSDGFIGADSSLKTNLEHLEEYYVVTELSLP
jgi:hypothetical protein